MTKEFLEKYGGKVLSELMKTKGNRLDNFIFVEADGKKYRLKVTPVEQVGNKLRKRKAL